MRFCFGELMDGRLFIHFEDLGLRAQVALSRNDMRSLGDELERVLRKYDDPSSEETISENSPRGMMNPNETRNAV